MTYEEEIEKVPFAPEVESAIREAVVVRAPERLAKLISAQSEEEAFVHLPGAAAAAFHLGQFADAQLYAERALALMPGYRNSWNYGNAIHLGHTVRGLLALGEGDVERAVAELHASACTEGSPQLNSFGPTMQLAKALLLAGRVEPVLAYLARCRTFWKSGEAWLDIWERKIQAGEVPNFFQHLYA